MNEFDDIRPHFIEQDWGVDDSWPKMVGGGSSNIHGDYTGP